MHEIQDKADGIHKWISMNDVDYQLGLRKTSSDYHFRLVGETLLAGSGSPKCYVLQFTGNESYLSIAINMSSNSNILVKMQQADSASTFCFYRRDSENDMKYFNDILHRTSKKYSM